MYSQGKIINIESGKIEGDFNVTEDFQLNGVITGNVKAANRAYFILNGTVSKDLIITEGATVDVNGVVNGNIINEGGTVNVEGVVVGIIIGTANVSANAVVG